MSFLEGVVIQVLILSIITQSVYIITGITGLFSLGQASFVAAGAYTAGVLSVKLGLPFPLCIAGGIIVSMLLSLLIGLPSLRLRHVYFSLATIAFCYGLESVLNVSTDFLGGAIGLIGIPTVTRWWHVFVALIIVYITIRFFRLSRYGRACIAIRTDEVAAGSYGINPAVNKQIVFTLSAAVCGLAGGLLAFYLGYLNPSMFGVSASSEYLVMVFFGGLISQEWVLIGTVILSVLMEILRTASELRMVIYCTVVLGIIIYQPTGLYGIYNSLSKSQLSHRLNPKKIRRSSSWKYLSHYLNYLTTLFRKNKEQ